MENEKELSECEAETSRVAENHSNVCEAQYMCNTCSKRFKHRQSLHKHKVNVHKIETGDTGTCHCQQPTCTFNGTSINVLRQHLETDHGLKFIEETLVFQSEEEFVTWKEDFERNENVTFVRACGVKKRSDVNVTYYHCNRDGDYTSKATGKRRAKKSCKIGHNCTATLTVWHELDNKSVKVHYCKTHYGHETEVGYLRIPQAERIRIAQLLKMKVSISEIMNEICNSMSTSLERIHIATRMDIMNIERAFGLRGIERHNDDATSFKILLKELEAQPENPVLKCKMQNEELLEMHGLEKKDLFFVFQNQMQKFMMKNFGNNIICIDSTHGTNGYNFVLITVLVIDEFGEGFPVAWCISNREDTTTMKYFFQVLHNETGPLTPTWFMSDDAPQYFNAWVQVFGSGPKKLLCSWHVDRNWRNHLKLIKNPTIKCEMYHTLRVLMEELDVNNFQDLVQQLKLRFTEVEEISEFGNYFHETYLKRPEEWAYCFRKGAGINTNMYVEALQSSETCLYERQTQQTYGQMPLHPHITY